MKIAQVCSRYHPYRGGVETVVKNIGERLAKKDFDVEVLTQDPSAKSPVTEIINNVTVRRFRTGPLGLDFPFLNGTLRRYLKAKSKEYDLIHAHSYHTFPALYAAWTKKENKLVLNAHYHGKGHSFLMSLLHIPYRFIGKVMFERADKVICVSEFEKALIQSHFSTPLHKFAVIPNGINLDDIGAANPFPFHGRLILYVGRLEKYKNIHLAIQAMPHLSSQYNLMIIGDGPYKAKLQGLIKRSRIADRVQILSGLSNEEVYQWYKTSDTVINLSSQEAFGITVIEGLAAGKPVMVNNRMALAEIATRFDSVYAVDAETLPPAQLAEQIALRCDEEVNVPDLSEYSWDSITEQIKKLYESL